MHRPSDRVGVRVGIRKAEAIAGWAETSEVDGLFLEMELSN